MCKKRGVNNTLWGVNVTNHHPSLKEFQANLQLNNNDKKKNESLNQQCFIQKRLIKENNKQKRGLWNCNFTFLLCLGSCLFVFSVLGKLSWEGTCLGNWEL